MHAGRHEQCSLVGRFLCFLLIVFIVENVDSQVYVLTNKDITFLNKLLQSAKIFFRHQTIISTLKLLCLQFSGYIELETLKQSK